MTRKLILRVDRVELSKNLLRGFRALDLLLEEHPGGGSRWSSAPSSTRAGRGWPSTSPTARRSRRLIERINAQLGGRRRLGRRSSTTPATTTPARSPPLQRADVLLVNPVRDGMNLVAKEGPLLNRRDVVLLLSTGAGAWAELGPAGAVRVNPFDVAGTAGALHAALTARRRRVSGRPSPRRQLESERPLPAPAHRLAGRAARRLIAVPHPPFWGQSFDGYPPKICPRNGGEEGQSARVTVEWSSTVRVPTHGSPVPPAGGPNDSSKRPTVSATARRRAPVSRS